MSRNWMPFNVGDYLSDTMHLNTLQHGMYLLLIFHYWKHGGLPKTTAGRSRVAGVPWQTFRDHEVTLAGFFSGPDWRHKRIDEELAKYERLKQKRQLAGMIGGVKSKIKRDLRAAYAVANATRPRVANAVASATTTTKKDIDSYLSSDSEFGTAREEARRVGEEARGLGDWRALNGAHPLAPSEYLLNSRLVKGEADG